MTGVLFDYLPEARILAALQHSPGNELQSGKFASPESSAALAVNAFGFFLDRPALLPAIPGTEGCGWPALNVEVEQCAPFPWWPAGRHPWLDAFVETGTHIIGIESKRFEPFRAKRPGSFSEAYLRPVWGDRMGPFERARDRLANGEWMLECVDAVQLVKHAFGLRTEALKRGKAVSLVYLYAEPEAWPDGRAIAGEHRRRHAEEIQRFADAVDGAEVAFVACSYRALLDTWRKSTEAAVRQHAENVDERFQP